MKNSSSHTGTIIVIIVVVLAAVGYFYTKGGSAPADSSGLVAMGDSDVGLAEINLLNQMQSIQIDVTLFDNSTFKSLVDHTIEIPPQNVGRPNPFAPIPGVADPAASSAEGR